jgi:hypothetical protein
MFIAPYFIAFVTDESSVWLRCHRHTTDMKEMNFSLLKTGFVYFSAGKEFHYNITSIAQCTLHVSRFALQYRNINHVCNCKSAMLPCKPYNMTQTVPFTCHHSKISKTYR